LCSLRQERGGVPKVDAEFRQLAARDAGRSAVGFDAALPDVTTDHLRVVPHEEPEFLGGQNGWESRCHARSIANRGVSK